MKKDKREFDLSDVIGGALDIFGIKIDLGKLLSSPEGVRTRLEELRKKLKQAGGKEVLTDEEWGKGGLGISGHVRTSGVLGEREYHVGTGVRPRGQRRPSRAAGPSKISEPAVDVFDEPREIMVVAQVPGVGLNDLEVKISGKLLTLSTKPEACMGYRKDIELSSEVDVDSLKATCRNGILEVRLRKKDGKGE